jgi:hypothetical protein
MLNAHGLHEMAIGYLGLYLAKYIALNLHLHWTPLHL